MIIYCLLMFAIVLLCVCKVKVFGKAYFCQKLYEFISNDKVLHDFEEFLEYFIEIKGYKHVTFFVSF